MTLPDPLKGGEKARLIPVVKDTCLEDRASSILLSCFEAIPQFNKSMLLTVGQKVGVQAQISCFTQVCLDEPKNKPLRPDGFIRIQRGQKVWTALVEAKIKQNSIEKDQLLSYIELANNNNIDAVITISNQFATKPDHHPIKLGVREKKGVEIYHWSWMFAVTEAFLVQQGDGVADLTQSFILDEFIRYFDHESVGVKGFQQMNSEWKQLVQTVNNGGVLKKASEEVQKTICSWHQEVKNLCLIMSRDLSVPVVQKLSNQHKNNPEMHTKDDIVDLIEYYGLFATLLVPDAAAPINITADLTRRAIECSMEMKAPTDRKLAKAQVTWLLNQLKKANSQNVEIRAWHKGAQKDQYEQASLNEIIEDSTVLVQEGKERTLFSRFTVVQTIDLAGKFAGQKLLLSN